MKTDNNIIKKSLISIIFFLGFVLIVFYFIFRQNDLKTIITILQDTNKFYLFLAFICMAFFSVFEAINLRRILTLLGHKIKFLKAYKYALAGFFLSSITPSSSGGDPAQLYLMSKDKLPLSHSIITLLLKLLTFQFVAVTVSLISFFTSYNLFKELSLVKYLIYLGIFLNSLVFTFYFFLIFYKKVIVFFIEAFSKLLTKFHYSKVDLLKEKLYSHLDEFSEAANILKANKGIFVKNILTTYLQMLLYYSISYFVYLAFGLRKETIFTFIALQSLLFISVSFLPFPGAVGISEGAFFYLYTSIYGEIYLSSAMLMTRFINFYFFVFYSGIVTFICFLKNVQKKNINTKAS